MGQGAQRKIDYNAMVVQKLLKLGSGGRSVMCHQVRLPRM
jgi:hypothetical protein